MLFAKGSKQNTKSRLNSGKTLSLPLFSCVYVFLLLFSLLSLSLPLFLHLLFLHRSNVVQRLRFQISFRGNIEFPPSPPALSHLEIESPMVISFGAIYIGFARVETPLSARTAPSSSSSWQLYNEISRVGPLDLSFLPPWTVNSSSTIRRKDR